MTTGNFPTLDPLDPRLNVFRPEIADIRLKDRIEAERFTEGIPARIAVPLSDLRSSPDDASSIDHQLLLGEAIRIFDNKGGWVWLQCERDRYVGWTRAQNIALHAPKPTHVVCVPRTFEYPGPDLKLPTRRALSIGSFLQPIDEVETRGTRYHVMEDGTAVIARHVRSIEDNASDYVDVARSFLHTPYLWGGASGFGLDCSGLVELSMRMCGRQVLRDSDMQAATIGDPVDAGDDYCNLIRGDLIFWRGHVAIAEGDGNLVHANGYTMDVTSEPVSQALSRIETMFEKPIGCRRPD